jgi:hypothetical protein
MKQKLDNEQLMTRYLLGELSEAEQLRLEERFFTDDEYYQQLLALEDELRYDYAQGGLTPQQRAQFERRFLTSPEERRKVDMAQMVLGKIADAAKVQTPERILATPVSSSWWQPLLDFFSLRNPAMPFSLAAAALVLLFGGAWLAFETWRLRADIERLESARIGEKQASEQQIAEQRARQEQLRDELERERKARAELEQELAKREQERRESAQSTTFLSFLLTPGLARDVAGPKRLFIPPDAGWLRLQLDLKGRGEYKGYRAALRKETPEGPELWSQDLPRAKQVVSSRAIILSLPARLLPPGDYVVILHGRTEGGEMEEIDEYYFSVVKQ